MTFAHPWLLLLLLLLPLLAWLKGKRGRPPAFLYSSVQLVRAVLNVSRSRAGGFLAALRWLALALLVVAMAQPRLTKSQTQVKASGIDIAVAIDLSGSMASEDFEVGNGRVNRIDMAKTVLKKFIEKRPGDRIGLIAFATEAYIAAPLTLDHDFLLQSLERLDLNVVDGSRTAIGSGLGTAINRLRDLKSKSKIVILMTDGQNNAGKIAPLTVAEAAQTLGVKVYTIGVGMRGMAPMPGRDMFGRKGYQMQRVDIDEDTLQKVADMTGGKYYRADNAERFQQIYAEIDKLEKSEAVIKKYTEFKELFAWLISPGLALLMIELLLKNTLLEVAVSFAAPQILWLLLVFPPALLAFFWWSWRVRQKLMAQFIQARLLPGLIAGVSVTRQKIRAGLIIAAVTCLILALARPQLGYDQEEVAQRGLDIVVAIDTSKSMLATDIAPNRLARAKLAALDLMQQARSDRLGLVAFAGSAFLACPLTIDDVAFRQSVESLDINTIPEGGTALAEAINTALKAFKEGDNYKVLVLFTDGEDNDEGAVEAAQNAAKEGLRIFTVGIGTAKGELISIADKNGHTDFVRDEQGNVVKSHLNEQLLQQIAGEAGGAYYPFGANTVDALYQRSLAPLPKSEGKEQWVKRPHERYHWPLALAIVLLLVEMFFPERAPKSSRLRSEASAGQEVQNSKPKVEAVVVAALVTLLLPIAANASPSTAIVDYKAGNFADAQKEFERLAALDKKGDMRLIFNAGDAAYRMTNYDEALKFFTTTLTSPDVKLQQKAYFNIGNTQFQLGAAAKDLDGAEELWNQAIKSFQNAVALDKTDADAAHNLKFVKDNVAIIGQLREAARRAKEESDSSVRRRNYHRALEILAQQVQNNIAARPFTNYVQRLKDIDEIATPQQP